MSDSILVTIKEMLGIPEEDTAFDTELIVHINSAFLTLQQLASGPEEPFAISGKSDTWDNFGGEPIEAVKDYIYLSVRSVFDPPSSSAVVQAYKDQMAALEFRINIHNDDGGGGLSG